MATPRRADGSGACVKDCMWFGDLPRVKSRSGDKRGRRFEPYGQN